MSIRRVVESIIVEVAAEQSKELPELTDGLLLTDSGLDSLCVAVIVAKLEDKLGVDPFTSMDILEFPKTIGDFIGLYELALV